MQVGVACVDVTPRWPVWQDGFADRERPAEGVDRAVEAQAVVFDNGVARRALMAIDICAIDDYLLLPLRRAAAQLGIPAAALMVNTSHTHSGPNASRIRGFCREFDDRYLAELGDKLAGVLAAALANLSPATLHYAAGTCTMGISRRRHREGAEAGFQPTADKPVDFAVPTLSVLSPSGERRALLFGYGCHPSAVASYNVGTDYPGYARDYVRSRCIGCTPVFLQGCGGDVKPRHLTAALNFAYGPVEAVEELGRELGRAVVAGLCGRSLALGDGLAAASAVVEVPFDHQPTEEEIAAAESSAGPVPRAWAAAVRDALARDGRLRDSLPIEVQVLNVGGLRFVGIAAEVGTGIGLRLKRELAGMPVWPMGYCNGSWDYLEPREEYADGGYEVRSSHMDSIHPFPKPLGLAPGAEDVVVGKAVELARSL
jgi:neutral ceramidase